MALTAAALLGAGSALPSPAHALALPKVSNISDSSPGDGGSANSNLVTGLANHTELTFEVWAVNDIGPGIAARAVATPSVSSESGRGICNRTPAVRDRPMVLLGQALTPACTGDCAGVTDVWLARLTSVQLVAPAIGPHRSGVAMRCGAHLLVIEAALYRHESTARNPSTIVVPGSRAIACVNVQERLVIRETREPFAVAMMPVHKCATTPPCRRGLGTGIDELVADARVFRPSGNQSPAQHGEPAPAVLVAHHGRVLARGEVVARAQVQGRASFADWRARA